MLYYIRKQEVGKTPKQELAKKGFNMTTFLNFEYLKHIAETTAKEDPKNAQYIGTEKSIEIDENTERDVFTTILHNGSKAAERVLKESYALAADPRVEAEATEYIIGDQVWKRIIYHYNEEFEGQTISCYAGIMLVRR